MKHKPFNEQEIKHLLTCACSHVGWERLPLYKVQDAIPDRSRTELRTEIKRITTWVYSQLGFVRLDLIPRGDTIDPVARRITFFGRDWVQLGQPNQEVLAANLKGDVDKLTHLYFMDQVLPPKAKDFKALGFILRKRNQ